MPSQTYYNLSLEKRQKLISAAKREFGRALLSDASINQIIKDAGISRGSFYMYFDSKEDLYAYILKEYRINGIEKLVALIEKNKGDLVKSFKELFHLFNNYCQDNEEKQFFKNIFKNSNLYMENKTFKNNEVPEYSLIYKRLELLIDKKKLSKDARENIQGVINILMDITMKSIVFSIMFENSNKNPEEEFLKMLKLIEGGISK